ncbi:hypothetical protein NPIL_68991 [Nephila pilipes]|uniref:Uncharacterized protein n=1 Tax=Nephila pilipes TaxID=299642 RepID=A0A8X6MV44_NEPPI|nr:hypothetical protein NPIL_68991 [Nephila pilipes]
MAKPTVVSIVQRGTYPPRRNRSRSKEEKKPPKRSLTDEGKSSRKHTFLGPRSQEARPCDPRSQEVRPRDPRSQKARPRDLKIHPRHIPAFGRFPSLVLGRTPSPIFFHHHGMAVFSSRNDGLTLRNGVVS